MTSGILLDFFPGSHGGISHAFFNASAARPLLSQASVVSESPEARAEVVP